MFSLIPGWLKAAAAAIAAATLGVVIFLIRKSGADAERLRQTQEQLKSARTVSEERSKARAKSDEELDKEVDKWTRRD